MNSNKYDKISEYIYKCKCCSKQLTPSTINSHYMNNHMAEIVPCLYLGSYGMVNKHELAFFKITDIINTAVEVCYDLKGYNCYKLHLHDTVQQHLIEYLDSICDHIHTLRNAKCRVMVHCFMGISRSASIVIAYLIKYYNMTYDEAYKYVNERRHVLPNTRFEKELREYSDKINKMDTSD